MGSPVIPPEVVEAYEKLAKLDWDTRPIAEVDFILCKLWAKGVKEGIRRGEIQYGKPEETDTQAEEIDIRDSCGTSSQPGECDNNIGQD